MMHAAVDEKACRAKAISNREEIKLVALTKITVSYAWLKKSLSRLVENSSKLNNSYTGTIWSL